MQGQALADRASASAHAVGRHTAAVLAAGSHGDRALDALEEDPAHGPADLADIPVVGLEHDQDVMRAPFLYQTKQTNHTDSWNPHAGDPFVVHLLHHQKNPLDKQDRMP